MQQLDHVRNEIQILSRLRCRFVPELKAVFQDENSVYIMSEYTPGGLILVLRVVPTSNSFT